MCNENNKPKENIENNNDNNKNNKNNEKKFMQNIIQDNADLFYDAVKDDVPDFDTMMASVFKKIEAEEKSNQNIIKMPNSNKNNKNNKKIFKKFMTAAAIGVVVAGTIFTMSKPADASKLTIFNRTIEFKDGWFSVRLADDERDTTEVSNEANTFMNETQRFMTIDEAVEKINRPFYIPEYIPEGYELNYIEFTDYPKNNYYVTYKYSYGDSKVFQIEQRGSGETSIIADSKFMEDVFTDKDVYYILNNSAKNVFWSEGNREICIIVDEPDDEIVKIIQNIKINSR